MADIEENALRIAKVMYDNDFTGANMIRVADLKKLLTLSAQDFDSADSFLLETRYCDGTIGGDEGERVLKAPGNVFAKAKLDNEGHNPNTDLPSANSTQDILNISDGDAKENIEHANKLYSQVMAMTQDWSIVDDPKAQLVIEYAKDAIESYGQRDQEKKVELKRVIEKAEEIKLPDSIDSLKKRAEKALLRVVYPKNPRLRNVLLFLTLVLIIMPLIIAISAQFKSEKKHEDTRVQPSPNTQLTQPTVYEPFAATHEIHKAQLGKPRREAVDDGNVYQAAHEHATAIWFKSLTVFYVLDHRSFKWSTYPDPYWDAESNWTNDTWLRERFRPPKNLGPPYSGVAKLWDRDEKSWSWIGGRVFHCSYISGGVRYQEFEHGIIMGSFLRNPKWKEETQVFVLIDEDRWSSRQSASLISPVCTDPS